MKDAPVAQELSSNGVVATNTHVFPLGCASISMVESRHYFPIGTVKPLVEADRFKHVDLNEPILLFDLS